MRSLALLLALAMAMSAIAPVQAHPASDCSPYYSGYRSTGSKAPCVQTTYRRVARYRTVKYYVNVPVKRYSSAAHCRVAPKRYYPAKRVVHHYYHPAPASKPAVVDAYAFPAYVAPAALAPSPERINSALVLGSAGLFGDPEMALFTSAKSLRISNIPDALRRISVTAADRNRLDNSTLLEDPDGLRISVKTIDVSSGRWGVGQVHVNASGDDIVFDYQGHVWINGSPAQLNETGLQLPGGAWLSTRQLKDVYAANHREYAEKWVLTHAGYQLSIARRSPLEATPYLDLNLEEQYRHAGAANNATSGFSMTLNGQAIGFADLLSLEPSSAILKQLLQQSKVPNSNI